MKSLYKLTFFLICITSSISCSGYIHVLPTPHYVKRDEQYCSGLSGYTKICDGFESDSTDFRSGHQKGVKPAKNKHIRIFVFVVNEKKYKVRHDRKFCQVFIEKTKNGIRCHVFNGDPSEKWLKSHSCMLEGYSTK